jgi:purine-nucleoside phosphorylase
MGDLRGGLERAVSTWDGWGWPRPAALLVTGSGLSLDLLPAVAGERRPLGELLPFGIEAVSGHPLSVELLGGETACPVLYQRGRIHAYQGHSAGQTVFMVRLAALLGAGLVIQTNASGSLRPDVAPGSLVLVSDHLNLIGLNPLRGELPEAWGPRFPDMTAAYAPELREEARGMAAARGFELPEGVYAAVAGPSYETPAEIRMLRAMGADLVGMSTVLEVIAARHMGLENLVISVVSNHAAGIAERPLDHREVLAAGRAASERLGGLLGDLLAVRMGR